MACSRHDNLLCSPRNPFRNDVWKVEGVSTFSLGVLVRGHGIHIKCKIKLNELVWMPGLVP